jgi:hypothetical protein
MTHSQIRRAASAALVTLVLAAAPAAAQGKRKGQVKPEPNPSTQTPPGLAKKGGLPPGQAKKVYRPEEGVVVLRDVFGRNGYTVVRTETYRDSRYVYYRTRDGVLRRAIVSPGTERLSFSNVPALVLREVLARLC